MVPNKSPKGRLNEKNKTKQIQNELHKCMLMAECMIQRAAAGEVGCWQCWRAVCVDVGLQIPRLSGGTVRLGGTAPRPQRQGRTGERPGGQITLSLLLSHTKGAEQLCVCDSKKTPHWVPPSERTAQAHKAARCWRSWKALRQPNRPTHRHFPADRRRCSLQRAAVYRRVSKQVRPQWEEKLPAVYRLKTELRCTGWI